MTSLQVRSDVAVYRDNSRPAEFQLYIREMGKHIKRKHENLVLAICLKTTKAESCQVNKCQVDAIL